MRIEGMAVGTDQIGTVLGHVHIKFARRIFQGGIEVAMLDGIATTTADMAGTAIGATGFADILGDLGQVRRLEHFLARRALHRLEFPVRIKRMTGISAKFLVGAGVVMAGQAVDIILIGKVEILVGPAVAGMATRAARLVGNRRAAEVIGRPFFADLLACRRVGGFPGPVNALHDLVASRVVATQTSLGDFRPGLERAFECIELAVVSGGF